MQVDSIHKGITHLLDSIEENSEFRILVAALKYYLGTLEKCPVYRIFDVARLVEHWQQQTFSDSLRVEFAKNIPYAAFTVLCGEHCYFYSRNIKNSGGMNFDAIESDWYSVVIPDINARRLHPMGPFFYLNNEIRFSPEMTATMPDDVIEEVKVFAQNAVTLVGVLALHAENVATIPIDRRVIKKRTKQKKVPFVEYKILTLDKAAREHVPQKYAYKVLNKNLPKCHDRAGHYRNYKNGKRIYIKDCIVAIKNLHTRGRVHKDYDVTI